MEGDTCFVLVSFYQKHGGIESLRRACIGLMIFLSKLIRVTFEFEKSNKDRLSPYLDRFLGALVRNIELKIVKEF